MPRHEDDEFDVSVERKENYETGGRSYLQVPSGLRAFNHKNPRTVGLEFIPFRVSEAHLRYARDLQYVRPGAWYVRRTFEAHRGVGPDNEWHACARRTFGNRCPICDVRDRYAQLPDRENLKKAADLKSTRRQLYLAMERDDHDGRLMPQMLLWDESYHSFGKQLQIYIDGTPRIDREAYEKFYHPTRGYTVFVTGNKEKTGDGGGEYTKWFVREFRGRREEIPRSVFDHGFDLDTFIVETPYEDLKRIFLGADADAAATAVGRTSAPVSAEPPRNGARAEARYPDAERRAQEEPRREEPPRRDPERTRRDTDPDVRAAPEHDDRRQEAVPARREPPPEPKPEPKPRVKPKPAPKFASLDTVSFNYRGETVTGVIESVDYDKEIARVKVEGREKPATLDFDELTLVQSDTTFDAKPEPAPRPAPRAAEPPPKPAGPASRWDDDDFDDGRSAFTKQPPAPRPAPPADDDPPPRRR